MFSPRRMSPAEAALPYVARDPFVRQLWMLGFEFVVETAQSHIFRRGPAKIAVPKTDHLDHAWAREQLERAGVELHAIAATLKAA